MKQDAITELFSERWQVDKLPHSKCRNCNHELRLYKGKWAHVEMGGGQYYIPSAACERPYPLRCSKCGGKIDYKREDVGYYDYECEACIADKKRGDKIGDITPELRKKLEDGSGEYLMYGTSCSVVLTRKGIFFEDIC